MELILKKPRKESDIYQDKLLITLYLKANKIDTFSVYLMYGKGVGKYVKTRVDSSTLVAAKIQSET